MGEMHWLLLAVMPLARTLCAAQSCQRHLPPPMSAAMLTLAWCRACCPTATCQVRDCWARLGGCWLTLAQGCNRVLVYKR